MVQGEFRYLLDDIVLGERAMARGLLRPEFLRQLVDEHVSGKAKHTERLWTLVNFELWQRHVLDGEELPGALPEVA